MTGPHVRSGLGKDKGREVVKPEGAMKSAAADVTEDARISGKEPAMCARTAHAGSLALRFKRTFLMVVWENSGCP